MARSAVARSKTTKKRQSVEGVFLAKTSIHRILSTAIDNIVDEVDAIRGVAASLHDQASLSTGAEPEELRRAAGVVRTHALGMLLSVAQLIGNAETLATMADVKASGGAL